MNLMEIGLEGVEWMDVGERNTNATQDLNFKASNDLLSLCS